MNMQGAIFDMDGTLLDSMYVWETVGADYLRSRGVEPPAGLRETLRPMSLRQAAEHLRAAFGLTEPAEEIMRGVNERVAEGYRRRFVCKPYIPELLERLRRQGVRMCVATATDRPLAEAALQRNGILEYFSFLLTCTEVGVGKDSPLFFRKALVQLGTDKPNTFVFEDALYALQTAKADGFPVVGVYDPSADGQRADILRLSDVYLPSYEPACLQKAGLPV